MVIQNSFNLIFEQSPTSLLSTSFHLCLHEGLYKPFLIILSRQYFDSSCSVGAFILEKGESLQKGLLSLAGKPLSRTFFFNVIEFIGRSVLCKTKMHVGSKA